jgi:S-DNA-T family DNA segregation ATPase FtsK/SpoIIIE
MITEKDELYETAKGLVLNTGQASTSFLQRRLRLGYARAARILDLMEQDGLVGPPQGSRPREVLVDSKTQTVS